MKLSGQRQARGRRSVCPAAPGRRGRRLLVGALVARRAHLLPTFENVALGDIDEAAVRRWRRERLDSGPRQQRPFGPVTVAKA